MIKRIIDISEPAYLHLKNKQLFIDKDKVTVGKIPIEDIGIIILENSQITLTQASIIACQKNNTAIVFCDERHLPYSLLLPISDGNALHNKVLRSQIEMSKPCKKQLWKQIVHNKIIQQSLTLQKARKNTTQLNRLAKKIKSGDPENIEAQAAKKYWHLLFGDKFRRNINETGINSLLNYGYSIVRAMTARAVVGSGLHPALGVFHQNQYNGLCLVDDLMEPFRPWIDWLVFNLSTNNPNSNFEVNKQNKSLFLKLPSEMVEFNNKTMPLMVACHYLVSDFKKSFKNNNFKLIYPNWSRQLSLQ